MSSVEDFFQDQSQQAKVGLAASMDDDPETTARSLDLSEATGIPATAISGDLDGFERQHKAALGSAIVQNNHYIADYLTSHPLSPRLSHDDLGQLDVASQAMAKIPEKSGLQRVHEALKIGSLAEKAFPDDPLKPYKEFGLSRPQDIEWAARNPELSAVGIGVASLVGYPFLFAGQMLGGVTNIINEFGGRQAASMFEYGLMRGDIRSPGTGSFGDVEAIGNSMRVAAPWLRAGKGAPSGIDPTLDKLKIDQAKADSDTLSDALKESLKSATRERNADFYSNFARAHVGDREIGISADAVRDLYGDKTPSGDDNLLGWVPDIEAKLAAAEATGGDIKVPLADWLAKVDPEVAKQLEDHIRARPDGVTVDEGKVAAEGEPKETITEPHTLVRGSASLEPMFSVGDRKVKLERLKAAGLEGDEQAKAYAQSQGAIWDRLSEIQKNGYREDAKDINFQGRDVQFHDFNLLDQEGKPVGSINLSEQSGGKQLYIEMIQAGADKRMYDPNFLGPALVRDIARQLKVEFPNAFGPDGLGITGHRVSGAREKAGTYNEPHATPKIKWEDLNDPTKWKDVHEAWQEIQKGVQGKPIEMTPEKQKVVDAVNEVLDRIVPKGVGVEGFEKIKADDGSRKGGVYSRYEDSLPWISWSLESPDPVATTRHEAIHHLRQSGFFKEGEWDVLSRAARDGDWIKQYRIDERYADQKLSNSEKLEESIADAYKNWARQPEAETTIGKIFSRIKEILDSIKTSLKEAFGRDLTFEELFRKVESGEIGSREGKLGEVGTKFSQEPPKPANDRTWQDANWKRMDYLTQEMDKINEKRNPVEFDWLRFNKLKEESNRLSKSSGPRPKFDQGDIPDIGGKEAEKLRERISELSGELSVAKSQGREPDAGMKAELKELRERLRSTTSGTFNMTVDQYQRYMKLIEKRNTEDLEAAGKRALEQQRKTQTKEWKENRTAIRDAVREELDNDPNLTVDQLMTSEKVKFHPDFLSDEQKAMLPKEYIQKKNGINPDDVAGYFGYASGDALVERLALTTHDRLQAGMSSREWFNHLIDSETDRRMEQRYGNLDERILAEAKDQAISETQLDLLHEEVLYLGLKAGSEFPISKTQLRQWNKEIFDKTPIGSISTDEYLRTAGKAGKAAEMSLLKEDFADAFREKQRQNNAMIMANYAKQYEKARKSFDRTAKVFQKREVPSVSQEWTNWIHDILQRTGNRVNRSVQDLAENIGRQSEQTLQDFVEAKEAETFGLRETPVADFLLEPSFRQEIGKLTAEQFYGLKQSIDVLAKQGRDEKKIYAQGEAADRNQVLSEMREKLQTFPKQTLPDERSWIAEKMQGPRIFTSIITAIPTLLHRWDRADPRGVFNRYLNYPLRRAANTESVLQREVSKALGGLGPIENGNKLIDAPFADPLTRSEAEPEGRPWPGFTRNHVLGMLAHAGNRSNWRVLAKGLSADPETLMQWLVRNTTKEDWQQAQKRGDTIFKPLITKADVVKEHTTGATVEKIPLEPIENEHGAFEGWYHPLDADPLRKEVWVKQDNGTWKRNSVGARDKLFDKYGRSYATTADGYTRKRSGAVYPLDLDISTMNGTINEMIHDISYSETLLEANKVMGNRSFQAEVTKHYGAEYTELLDDYIKDMAGGASIPSKAWQRAGRFSETLRQNVISTYIGYNIYTAFKHGPTALVMSSREVGLRNFAPEFAKQLPERLLGDPLRAALELVGADNYANAVKSLYARSPELGLTASEFAMKHSEELQRRERHWQDTIAGETKVIKGESTWREAIIENASWLVAQSDMLSAKPTWLAEYNKRMAQGLSHGESIDLADNAVARAHGSTAKTNQPALVRGGGAVHGWLTSVYGFMGNRMQHLIEIGHQLNDIHQLGKEGELREAAKKMPALLNDIMTWAIWPIMVEEAVMSMNTEDKRTLGTRLVSGLTMGMSSSVLYIRDLVHGLAGHHEPSVGLASSALHDVKNVFTDLSKGKEAFNRQHAGKTVGDLLTFLGEAKGIAPKTIGNATRFGIDLVNKQQHPRSASEYFRGFTRGTAKKREEK